MAATQNYLELQDYLSTNYDEINGYDFYRAIFPDNELEGELHKHYQRPNAIYLYRAEDEEPESKRTMRRRIMLHDTWEEDYMEYVEGTPGTLCSGLTFRGRVNRLNNAQCMNALIIDLDGVGLHEILTLHVRFKLPPEHIRSLPQPTYIVSSGNGVHIYYVLESPIDLYPNIKMQMKALKYALTFRMWDYKSTSQKESIQYQSISQGFRMVGSLNEKYGTPVVAYRTGEPVSLAELNAYVDEKHRVDLNKPFKPSKMSREQAREAYPEWYERVIVKGDRRPKKWNIAEKVNGADPYALYHWWVRRAGNIRGGHRYFFLMCMAIYAYKCDVPKKQLRADMAVVFEELKRVEHENPLTQADVFSALEAYDKEYYNFTIADIEALTDQRIDRNKRNGRKQVVHLMGARAIQEINDKVNGTDWRDGNGRPKGSGTKQELVQVYRLEHPEAKVSEVAKALKMSRTTVYKWWDTRDHIMVKVRPSKELSDAIIAELQKEESK